MGWATYKVERSRTNTGEKLSDLVLNFPKVEKQFNIGTGDKSLSDLLQYPDFPLESHVLVRRDTYQDAVNFGFPNILILEDHLNEKWVINNGSTIIITGSLGANTTITWKYPDGSNWLIDTIGAAWTHIRFLPCVVGADFEGRMPTVIMLSNGKIRYKDGNVPQYVSPNKFFLGATPIYETSDPYGDGGESATGGGTGTFSDTGDSIAVPGLPTLSAVNAGFITLFNPTISEMGSLASYMWSGLFDIDGWRKIFADPMDAILGLSIVPVAVPSAGAREVKVGNISTGVSMTVAASQYVTVDCGTLNVEEFWGAYLDYDPYTKAEIYLPYVGTHPIATDDIMGKAVHVVYNVDILSGACCAMIQCGGTVLYSFIGQCSSSIPITGDNWTNVINGAISIAGAIGSMVATGGASAPMAIGAIASTAVNQMKPSVEKSGAMGGTGGMLGVQKPYLILTRPRQAVPRDQNTYTGYPSFITEKLGDLTGYTEIEMIHIEGVPATENEISEIESLLKSGVIF